MSGQDRQAQSEGGPRIDGQRLWARLEALGEIGAIYGPNGERGCSRLALSDADRAGRDMVVTWMRDLGLDVGVDVIGNVFATLPGADASAAPVMMGSHIDTVRTGGRFDGNLGVLAGLEVIEAFLTANVIPERPVTVAFFTDEEGARFPPDMLGSLVHVGGMSVEDALDVSAVDDGARLGDELARIGYAGPLPCPAASFPAAFVELHIEQGPVLERERVGIGVVEGVQGISWTEYVLDGQSAHAGTTPMSLRHDPLVVAARIAAYARDLTGRIGGVPLATVGRFEVEPDLVNVVPARVTLTIDLRNTDDQALTEAERLVEAFVEETSAAEGVSVSRRSLARFEPVAFDADMVDLVERTAQRLGHVTLRMPSGAGHDAQMLARVCPAAMIFVPSVGGLSHNIAEYTTPSDVTAGAEVLMAVVAHLAGIAGAGD